LYNAVEAPERDWGLKAVVNNTGSVWFFPPATYKTVCRPSKQNGKIQQCSLNLGSWSYDAVLLPLEQLAGSFTDTYLQDCPYTISNINSGVKTTVYEGLDNPYQTLSVNFTIQPNDYHFKFRN
jgi:hypothetical protein